MRQSPIAHRAVPVVGYGTWKLEESPRAEAIAAVRAALDAGATHIDTAELYGHGRVESLLGEALAGRRDEVFLVSKVLPGNASRKGTVNACEHSLRRLRTDHLDLYLLHWEGPFPLQDTIAAFEQLVASGKIGAWGLSNFDVDSLQAARDIAGPGRIAANQVLYHLGERAIEHAVLPWCAAEGVALVGYSPFGAGDFPADHPALLALSAETGHSPHQLALAFLTRDSGLFTIPKSADPARVRQNSAAGAIRLSPDQLDRIAAAFPRGPRPAELPTL